MTEPVKSPARAEASEQTDRYHKRPLTNFAGRDERRRKQVVTLPMDVLLAIVRERLAYLQHGSDLDAVTQNTACEIERAMGVFPNLDGALSPASQPAEALPSQTSGAEAVNELLDQVIGRVRQALIDCAHATRGLNGKASSRFFEAEQLATGIIEGFKVDAPALSSPASSSPAEAEALQAGVEAVTETWSFLQDRLLEFEQEIGSGEEEREWAGHVHPALVRFNRLIASLSAPAQEDGSKELSAHPRGSGQNAGSVEADYAAICKELGCIAKPGVALRFIQDMRKQLSHANERQDWLLRTWDDATITERQELDRMRRGWGPTTPTERMRRQEDVQAAMHCISSAMADVTLSEEEAETADEEVNKRLDEAHERLRKHYVAIIAILDRIRDEPLERPDLPSLDDVRADLIGLRARCEGRRDLGITDGELDGDGEEMANLIVPLLMLERVIDALPPLENSKASLADATTNPVPLTLSDAGSDAEGRDDG